MPSHRMKRLSIRLSASSAMLIFAAVALSVQTSQAKRGCASFGHSCFGGHGKRSQQLGESTTALRNQLSLDPVDLQTVQLFRQLCSLQPEQYLRLGPIFRQLTENYIAEVEEPLPRK